MTQLPPSPFMIPPRSLDAAVTLFERELNDIVAELNDLPKFLIDPSPEYLSANELMPICKVLTQFVRAA